MKNTILLLSLFIIGSFNNYAQVGIGTTNPDASSILHIESNDKGVVLPKLTTLQRDAIVNPAISLLIYNTTSQQFEFNFGTPATPVWRPIASGALVSSDTNNTISTGTDGGAYLASTTYMGKFIISSTGNQTISSLPFQPSSVKFSAHANVESYDLDSDNGIRNNDTSFQNAFGSMQGYATNYGGSILQQSIYIGGSGNSINDISRYASSTRAIGVRYSNQNGDNVGLTAAAVTSFNPDGFTINVTNLRESIVVIYEAHR